MIFTFTVDNPQNLKKTFENVKNKIEKNGGIFEGTLTSGRIVDDGVHGHYMVGEKAIEITITKNPYLFQGPVKLYIEGVFRECSR